MRFIGMLLAATMAATIGCATRSLDEHAPTTMDMDTIPACGHVDQPPCAESDGGASCFGDTSPELVDLTPGANRWLCEPCGSYREPCCDSSAGNVTCHDGLHCAVGDWTCH
jgi:hypothetical protein